LPKYKYRCNDCEAEVETYHSITDKLIDCPICRTTSSLIKIPGNIITSVKQTKAKTPGSVVKKSIEGFREDLAREKEKMKNEFFESNE